MRIRCWGCDEEFDDEEFDNYCPNCGADNSLDPLEREMEDDNN